MDVGAVRTVVAPGGRKRVLQLIEAGAKARGDLGVANDARFSLEVIESREEPLWRRVPNVVFYRLVAGYFVRPLHPIAALLLLVASVALVRTAGRTSAASRLARRLWVAMCAFGHEFLDALALIAPGGGQEDRRGGRIEAFVYRLLLVCALIALGNTNPTVREMFDAVV
jgi:hypothetical protein